MTRRSDSILYKRWYQFVIGTTRPDSYAWPCYGARGIKMKRSWTAFKSGFDQFEHYVWSTLGPQPSPDAIIRRIDPTKDIKPGNLEWSTRKIQSNHRSTNLRITINGQTRSLGEWCEITGVNPRTAWSRYKDLGYTATQALGLEPI